MSLSGNPFPSSLIEGIEILALKLGNLKKEESLLVITDFTTFKMGDYFEKILKKKYVVKHLSIKPLKIHGQHINDQVSKIMNSSDLIIGLTKNSMAHSPERIESEKFGARYLSLPDYSDHLLEHRALRVDFKKIAKNAIHLAHKLSKTNHISIQTPLGTNLELTVEGRKGNFAPGFVNSEIKLGSPPDIECNIAPIENKSNGKIIVDGSIPHSNIGLLNSKITLSIDNGKLIDISGENVVVEKIKNLINFESDDVFLGEFGIGLNNKSNLCGNMLLDEGCFGTIHFGFGSNLALGGKINSNFHLDFVLNSTQCIFDEEKIKYKNFI